MKVVRLLCLLVLAAGVAAAQSATNNQAAVPHDEAGTVGSAIVQSTNGNNATLQGQIQQALRNASEVDSSRVSVNVTDAAIEISGTVASSKDKQAVERLARSFDGNRKFTNDLTITGQAPVGQSSTAANGVGSGSQMR